MDTGEYFLKAIDIIIKKEIEAQVKFFFFSEDMDWVKNKLIPLLPSNINFELVENDRINAYIDFYLISCCKHQIASLGAFALYAYAISKHEDKFRITPSNINTL